jgi:hypothetical protein
MLLLSFMKSPLQSQGSAIPSPGPLLEPADVSELTLYRHFAPYGGVLSCHVLTDSVTGRQRCAFSMIPSLTCKQLP